VDGVDVSPTLISQETEAVEAEVRDWQKDPSVNAYPLDWFGANVVKAHKKRTLSRKQIITDRLIKAVF